MRERGDAEAAWMHARGDSGGMVGRSEGRSGQPDWRAHTDGLHSRTSGVRWIEHDSAGDHAAL